jgi:hypothetical protein
MCKQNVGDLPTASQILPPLIPVTHPKLRPPPPVVHPIFNREPREPRERKTNFRVFGVFRGSNPAFRRVDSPFYRINSTFWVINSPPS